MSRVKVNKSVLNDERLSWDERGLLAYILCNRDGESITVKELVNQTTRSSKKVGRTRVYQILSRLEDLGLVSKMPCREAGRYSGIKYVVNICAEEI